MRLAPLALLSLACSHAWDDGTLVPPAELMPQTIHAAAWWNTQAGSVWQVAGSCGEASRCVPIELKSCPENIHAGGCTRHEYDPLSESYLIRIEPQALDYYPDIPMLIAHELGHIMGYEHEGSHPNVMWPENLRGAAWELP